MITENQPGTNTQLQLFEILNAIEKVDEKDRVSIMREFGTRYSSFKDYLRCVFDDRIQFLLPEGKPPYSPAKNPASTWHKKHMELKYWVKGTYADQMLPLKRETMFISMLEAIDPEDALLAIDMVAKKTPSKVLTRELVEESFPNLITESS